MLQFTLHLAKLVTLLLIERLDHLQQALLIGIECIHIHTVAVDHLHKQLVLLLLDLLLLNGGGLGDDSDIACSKNGLHGEDIMVVGKLAGRSANTDVCIAPPTAGEGNVIGKADMEIAAIILIDGHTHLLGGIVVTNLHNGVVIDLER